jgi:phosphoribosylaminoimidazole-succinocarboxamide synthase
VAILLETSLPIPLFRRGKVRDVYDLGDRLLIVSTDRISAFDVVLPCGIPEKGRVLNQISAFWFSRTSHLMPNHLIKVVEDKADLGEVTAWSGYPGDLPGHLAGRSMVVAKAERIPVECVVRGYLSGSAWTEYRETGAVSKASLPAGMKESQKLPQAVFTPTTKSETEHDRPLTDEDIQTLGIEGLMPDLEEKSLLIYQYAQRYAQSCGIMIADTKFEFGLMDGKLALIDELLTPDSSRFWSASQYEIGHSQPSFDKQPVRDWLSSSGWNKEPPAPTLPSDVIEATTERYTKIYQLFTGRPI